MAVYYEAGFFNVLDKATDTYHPMLAIKGDKGDPGPVASEEEIRRVTSEEVAKVVAEAPEDFDTLKEISDWIATHQDDASAMNTAILQNTADIATNASDIAVNTADIADLKSKGVGEEITYEDFQKLTEEQIANGDYYITDYPDEFANAENIPYKDTNVGEALDEINSNLTQLEEHIPQRATVNITTDSTGAGNAPLPNGFTPSDSHIVSVKYMVSGTAYASFNAANSYEQLGSDGLVRVYNASLKNVLVKVFIEKD